MKKNLKKNLKQKQIACVIIFIILTSAFSVFALPDNLMLSYDSKQKTLQVSADMGSKANILTTVTFSDNNLLSDNNLPNIFGAVFTDSGGSISTTFAIPENFKSGKYYVYVSNTDGELNDYFLFASDDDIESIMNLCNNQISVSGIETVIMNNYDKLAVESDFISPIASDISNIFYKLRPEIGYTDSATFFSDFKQCIAASLIKNGNDVFETLSIYKYDINIDVDAIMSYPNEVKESFKELLKTANFEKAFLSKQIPQLRVLSFFKAATTWGAVKLNILGEDENGDVYIDNFKVLSPDTTYYDKVTDVNNVYKKLFLYKDEINDFETLNRFFYTCSKEVYDSKSPLPNTGSGIVGNSTYSGSLSSAGGNIQDTEGVKRFADIENHWAKDYILMLVDKSIISGYPDESFQPDNGVSRAEFIKMAVSAFDISAIDFDIVFKDVSKSQWYFSYIKTAVAVKLINGISDDIFGPDLQISRQDACVILHRYMKKTYNFESSEKIYSDDEFISDYARESVYAFSDAAIIRGVGNGLFEPDKKLTRAQAAVILINVLDYMETH